MIDLEAFFRLLTPEGQRLLAAAAHLDLSEPARLRTLTELRRESTPDLAAAAYETAVLRRRALAKFPQADRMYFTREALEQASGALTAGHRARRFAQFACVADLGCGIGGDALALAGVTRVVSVDRDPLRLAMARENARVLGLAARTDWIQAEIGDGGPLRSEAAFVDPSRRRAGRRTFDPDAYDPPLSTVLSWRGTLAALAVKVAPGIPDEALQEFDGEVEFVAVGEELREAVLWMGAAATPGRRATLLPSGATLLDTPEPVERVAPVGRYLIEPNPALIRAHLLGQLARRLDAWQIDRTIAYLSADRQPDSPFARWWSVETVMPFSAARVRDHLRRQGVGLLTVKKRGSPIAPEDFIRMMRPAGPASRTVFLTRQQGRPVAIICLDAAPAASTQPEGRTDPASATMQGEDCP